jgi:hypothetical protein
MFCYIRQNYKGVNSNTSINNLNESNFNILNKSKDEIVIDNTEGVAGFYDLPIPSSARLLADIGGGKFDTGKLWLEAKYPDLRVVVLDPFARSPDHNNKCERIIQNANGACIVTSISVLNVIDTRYSRLQHCRVVYNCLKTNGTAYFKIWPGYYPLRGTQIPGIQ